MTDEHGRLGTVERDGDTVRLRYVRHLAHSPTTVWRALTESAGLRHWFPADIVGERAAGAEVQLPFWPEGAQQSMEMLDEAGVDTTGMDPDEVLPGLIRAFDPPTLFELVWGNSEGEADVLRFELEPVDGGTRLVFTTWPGEPGPLGHAGTAAGWHACLDELESMLRGAAGSAGAAGVAGPAGASGAAGSPDRDAAQQLREEYAARLAEA
ncbi:SRPBCC domain-containing protein [Georgenia sp. Z1491]|uniref:SRPBCC domain-containing protein n=1 Tax=Georgenia sp. Z1491 TaxID=3416707 RepID=UPI003CEB021A